MKHRMTVVTTNYSTYISGAVYILNKSGHGTKIQDPSEDHI